MSLTATISMSAPRLVRGAEDVAADAAEAVDPDAYGHDWNPFRESQLERRGSATERRSALAVGGAIDVAVLDLDEVASVASRKCAREVLGDHHRAVAAAGAADRDHEVRLALGHVLRAAGTRAAASTRS